MPVSREGGVLLMKGFEVIKKIEQFLEGNELIVSSNGNISRQVYHLLPKPQLYLRGSMGLPTAVGTGLALAQPERKIIDILGDGNFLMGMSSVATVAHLSPPNLKIIILDNEEYATTGGQKNTSPVINYEQLVKAFETKNVISTESNKSTIEKYLRQTLLTNKLSILHVKVDTGGKDLSNIPWHPQKIKKRVKRTINGN